MQDIKVSRYKDPKATGWAGWIEPSDKTWIAFIDLEGRPRFYLNRDPADGRCLPDDPNDRIVGAEAVEGGAMPPLVRPDGARLDEPVPDAGSEEPAAML